MSDVSKKVIRAYSWCQSLGDAHVAVLRDFARDTLARVKQYERELGIIKGIPSQADVAAAEKDLRNG